MKRDDETYEFGPYKISSRERQLFRHHTTIPLTQKVFETLLILVRRSGQLLDKAELINLVWGDSFVEEGSLAVIISKLRKALDCDPSAPSYIQTVSGRGYRFVGTLETQPHSTIARPAIVLLYANFTPVPSHRDRIETGWHNPRPETGVMRRCRFHNARAR